MKSVCQGDDCPLPEIDLSTLNSGRKYRVGELHIFPKREAFFSLFRNLKKASNNSRLTSI